MSDEPLADFREHSHLKGWEYTQNKRIWHIMSRIWTGSLREEGDDARYIFREKVFATLLTLTPNLSSLCLELAHCVTDRLGDILQHAKDSCKPDRPFLSKLTKLRINSPWIIEGDFLLSNMTAVLNLPSLTNVSARSFQETHKFPELGSNITTLSLIDMTFDEVEIANLIRSCKALKTFTLKDGPHWDAVPGALGFRRIGKALGKELESFIFNIDITIMAEYPPTIASSIGSLTHLTNLRKLDLPQCAFFGSRDDMLGENPMDWEDEVEQDIDSVFANRLPLGLEFLTVRSCTRLIVSHLSYCHHRRMESLPKLEKLVITAHPFSDGLINNVKTLLDLIKSFSDVGVSLEIIE